MRNLDRINCLPIKLIEPHPEKLRKSSRGSLGHPSVPPHTQADPSKVIVLEKCPQLP